MTDAATTPSTSDRAKADNWRSKLPKVPDPVRVDLPGVSPQWAFLVWLAVSALMLGGGIWLNFHLTDGQWVLPAQGVLDPDNPFGTTEVQFLTSHPYDVVTATLFVGATLLLGLSLAVAKEGWQRRRRLAVAGAVVGVVGLDILLSAFAPLSIAGAIGSMFSFIRLDALARPFLSFASLPAAVGVAGATALAAATIATGAAILGIWRLNRTGSASTVAALRHGLRAGGWLVFAFHWAATALMFFHIEGDDYVNAGFALASVPLLNYFAYQEYISLRQGKDNASLRFAAGAVFIAASVWYVFLRVEPLSEWIIEVVAAHTVALMHLLGQDVVIGPDGRTGFISAITYPEQTGPFQRTVIIILACTAIQSMMIFVAAALAVQRAAWRRRMLVIGVTVPVVYLLNLVRNVLIIFLWETRYLERNFGVSGDAAFGIAHNWIGKVGSLIALVFIAIFMFRVLPEVVHAVIGLLDLPRRRGPLERYVLGLLGKTDDTEPPEGGTTASVPATRGDVVGGES